MTISVIATFFNVEAYAQECIESIIGQSYKDLEIILVDDGSVDKSGMILDKYAAIDSRIVVVHEDNQGLSFARNTGMQMATGECYAFIDGDDAVKPNYIETMVSIMDTYDADMVGVGRFENVIENDSIRQYSPVDEISVYNDFRDYICDTYSGKTKNFLQSAIVVWGKLYRRIIWEGIIFPVGLVNEDSWVFVETVSRCKKIVVSPEPLYFYRKREGSIMSSMADKIICSQTNAWMHQIESWRLSNDLLAGRMLSLCEKFVCNFIHNHTHCYKGEYRKKMNREYSKMVRHMLFSKYVKFKTKAKYLTYANPLLVFGSKK